VARSVTLALLPSTLLLQRDFNMSTPWVEQVLRRRADLEQHRRSPLDAGPAASRGAVVDSACYSSEQTTCASAGGRNPKRHPRRCHRLAEQWRRALGDGRVESSGVGEELEDAVTEGREGAPT